MALTRSVVGGSLGVVAPRRPPKTLKNLGKIKVFASWGYLGPSWGHLGLYCASLRPSWGYLGPLWGILGPSWAHLGPFRGRWTSKNLDFPLFFLFLGFCNWTIFPSTSTILPYLAPSCPSLQPSWGHLGALLDPLGTILGSSWGPSATLDPSCLILGPSWATLGPPWRPHGPPWNTLGSCFAHLGPTWSLLGLSWSLLGAFLTNFGATLQPSWGHPGAILGYLGRHHLILRGNCRALLRLLNAPFYLSFSCLPTPKKQLASRSQALEEPRRGREALTIRPPILSDGQRAVLDRYNHSPKRFPRLAVPAEARLKRDS